jgi:hypothetical protein
MWYKEFLAEMKVQEPEYIRLFGTIEVCPDTFDGGNLLSIQVDYINTGTSAVSAGTPSGNNATPTLTMDPYTPAGTIAGGSGSGEVPNGTDLSAITNVEYRVVGL